MIVSDRVFVETEILQSFPSVCKFRVQHCNTRLSILRLDGAGREIVCPRLFVVSKLLGLFAWKYRIAGRLCEYK